MARAWQTPHGARPNREEVRSFGCRHVPARCVKPSGRSLEPGSNARPRGMVVPQQQCCGQNSAYRSGCLKAPFSTHSHRPAVKMMIFARPVSAGRLHAFETPDAAQEGDEYEDNIRVPTIRTQSGSTGGLSTEVARKLPRTTVIPLAEI